MPASFGIVFKGTQSETESPIERLKDAAVARRRRVVHRVVGKDGTGKIFSCGNVPRISDSSCAAVVHVTRRHQQLRSDAKGYRRALGFIEHLIAHPDQRIPMREKAFSQPERLQVELDAI